MSKQNYNQRTQQEVQAEKPNRGFETADEPSFTEAVQEPTPQPQKLVNQPPTDRLRSAPSTPSKITASSLVDMTLQSYVEVMEPNKPVNPVTGAAAQNSIFFLFKNILSKPDQDEFKAEWNAVLKFFNDNRDSKCLTEHFAFRFAERFPGGSNSWNQFRALMYLVINTASRDSRVDYKKYASSAGKLFGGRIESNLINFYEL